MFEYLIFSFQDWREDKLKELQFMTCLDVAWLMYLQDFLSDRLVL